jgi:hypothetical protein
MIAISLMTCHKGVDLHAASAAQVIRERLEGGGRLVGLARAEFHSFDAGAGRAESAGVAALLATGRCYNPNKHFYGHFRMPALGKPWRGPDCRGGALPPEWPGEAVATDLGRPDATLRDRLLGGEPPAGAGLFDVCAFPLGQAGPLLSGVVWRLVIAAGDPGPELLAERFVVARTVREGLLVNPHLEGWLVARRAPAARA